MLHLLDLMLIPGQAGHVDDGDMALVPIASTNFVQYVRHSMGVVVPYSVEGPGSFTGFYMALCDIAEADPDDIGYDQTWHPHVRLVGFAQLDNYVRMLPRWDEATISPGLVTVPVEFRNCAGHHGTVTFRVNDNYFGPNIEMTRDAGATFDPDTCLRP